MINTKDNVDCFFVVPVRPRVVGCRIPSLVGLTPSLIATLGKEVPTSALVSQAHSPMFTRSDYASTELSGELTHDSVAKFGGIS